MENMSCAGRFYAFFFFFFFGIVPPHPKSFVSYVCVCVVVVM